MSFTAKIQSSRNQCLYKVQGFEMSIPCWFYLMVDKAKLILFKHLAESEPQYQVELSKYGEILYSGWGVEPPLEIITRIKSDYNV